jgi:hypothetical protein
LLLVSVTFNGVNNSNVLGPIHLQGANGPNHNLWCSGNGKNLIYYNVTDLVSAGAENNATTTKIYATVGDFDGRVYGIVLVVVYEGGDVDMGKATKAELTMVHFTAYEPPCANCLAIAII